MLDSIDSQYIIKLFKIKIMKTINIYALFLTTLLIFSCADLEELEPINSIPSGTVFSSEASAEAAVIGVYDEMQDPTLVFDGWVGLPQFFSDEANATGTFPSRLEFGNLNVFPANATLDDVFTDLYDVINVANNVIAGVPLVDEASFTADEKADFMAQAKFLRAHCYLHLVTLWNEVPLVLTPTVDVGENLFVAKNSGGEIYEQIIKDFTEAANDLAAATGPTLASQQAANAFLARVALYQENWSEAIAKAETVLGAGFDLTAVPFLDDQIYTLGFIPTDGNSLNFFYGSADAGGRYSIGPSQTIIDAYEAGDLRFAQTLDLTSYSVPVSVKYPSFSAGSSGTATDPLYFIRHAEMVLILAEAEAEMGNYGTASAYLNQVRTRAGLAAVTLDATNYVDAILQERFVEFAFEGPQRLIDLRRKGKAESVLGPIGYDPCDNVWPIPQRDIDRNINLVQNSCCNC